MNMQVLNGVRTPSDYARNSYSLLWKKESFSAVGCFVDFSETGCTSAYQTMFNNTLKLVKCINQLGETRELSTMSIKLAP